MKVDYIVKAILLKYKELKFLCISFVFYVLSLRCSEIA